jgi:hypothetical protein
LPQEYITIGLSFVETLLIVSVQATCSFDVIGFAPPQDYALTHRPHKHDKLDAPRDWARQAPLA